MPVLLTKYHNLDPGTERVMDERKQHPGGISPAGLFDVIRYGGFHPGSRYARGGGQTLYDSDGIGHMVPRMAGGAMTAVQSNAQPVGGTTALQPVPPAGEVTPTDIATLVEQLTPAATRFRKASTLLNVSLSRANYTIQGDDQTVRFSNVGLGYLVVTHHHFAITLANAATAAQIVKFSEWFPYNLLNSSQIAINGGSATYSCNGLGGLLVAARARRGLLTLNTRAGRGEALDPALVQVSADTKGTFTNASAGAMPAQLSGVTQLSIAGSSSSVLTVDFITFEKVVADFDSGVGALPLQNNSTYATLERILPAAFISTSTTDQTFPMFDAGANISVSAVSGYSESQYFFASVPGDQTLYQDMVVNSYQVQQQRSVSFAATGTQAWVYNIPQNLFLTAAHTVWRDSTGAPINMNPSAVTGGLVSQLSIQYNGGSIIPVIEQAWMQGGLDYLNMGDERASGQVGGYRLWDGEATSNSLTSTDEMNWIDTYNAAQPQLVANVDSSVSVTGNVDVTREAIVSGTVQVVGG